MRGRRLTQSKKLSHLAVATDASSRSMLTRRSKSYVRKGICGVLLLAVAVGIFLYVQKDNNAPVPEQTGTDITVLVDQAKDVLSAENTAELETLVGKIIDTKQYETSQDALYVVVTYYIKTSNAAKAREYLDKLMLAYDGSKGFSKKLGTTKTILQLEADVIFLEKQASQFKDGLSAGVGEE